MEFKDMNINNELIESLSRQGIKSPTKIQAEVIMDAMAGHDIQAQSETGSGKTLAFALPMIEKVEKGRGIQALVLAPTRELARQITEEFFKFSKHKNIYTLPVYGGASINIQIAGLRRSEIIIGTPGRIMDLLERGNLKFDNLKFLVLDEADRMLDMGFVKDIERIHRQIPKKVQTMFFSATYPGEIKDIARRYLNNPKRVVVHSTLAKGKLLQYYYDIRKNDKFSLLLHLLKKEESNLCLVFCKTKRMTEAVSKNLYRHGVKAKALNGDMSQSQRDHVVDEFKDARINVLVATDVAARGIHVQDISHVYNYDAPDSPETYTHRIGRTARAGKTGISINLVSEFDHDEFGRIMRERGQEIQKMSANDFERVDFKNPESSRGGRGGFQRGGGFRRGNSGGFGHKNHEGRRGGDGESRGPRPQGGGRFQRRESSGSEGGQRSHGGGFGARRFGNRRPTRGPE